MESGLNIIGVQFIRAGKIYDFDGKDMEVRIGDQVVVETERGPAMATVVRLKFDEGNSKERVLKPVLRKASDKDLEESKHLTDKKVMNITRDKVKELNLDMRLLTSEVSLGGNKVTIYFTAPGRVDFRELVKSLASKLRARVELKQVGARDEAKILGGIGICGREFCCSTFLREFVPVSIKMAKNQNLALKPTKVSGGCGRLLCCLTYENDLYSELRTKMPPLKSRVVYDGDLQGDVIKTDLLNQMVVIEDAQGQQVSKKVAEITIIGGPQRHIQTDEDEWAGDLDLEELMDDK